MFDQGDKMVIGEQLWVGEGKTQIMIVQDVGSDGVAVEFTWYREVKGTGKAKGIDGGIVFTGRKLAPFSGFGKARAGKIVCSLKEKILSFLMKNPDKAFDIKEIIEGTGYS